MGLRIGGRIGPVSASTGVSGRGCGPFLYYFLILAVISLVVGWPFMLGSWLATKFGAAENSGATNVLGWVLEVPWLVVLGLGALGWLLGGGNDAKKRQKPRTAKPQRLKSDGAAKSAAPSSGPILPVPLPSPPSTPVVPPPAPSFQLDPSPMPSASAVVPPPTLASMPPPTTPPREPAPRPLPQPGWYDDPHRQAPLRYWDGRQWTIHTSQ